MKFSICDPPPGFERLVAASAYLLRRSFTFERGWGDAVDEAAYKILHQLLRTIQEEEEEG